MIQRRWTVLVMGLLLGAAGYCALYFSQTAREREMMDQPEPELAWLKKEFKISDTEFQRVSQLHDGYLPKCKEMCRRVAAKNAELATILAKTNAFNEDIQKKISEIAELRAQCQSQMLEHFFAVSRAMPPDQGKRYLAWVEAKTVLRGPGEEMMSDMH